MRRLSAFLLMVPLLSAVTVSAMARSPTTTEELLAGMVTEEVEPGVLRVVNDGVRDLTASLTFLMPTESPGIVAGDDGSVWIQGGTTIRTAFPLGGELVELPPGVEGPDFVTPDGTVWAGLHSYDGERWTERPAPPTDPENVQLYDSGGTRWAVWPEPPFEDADGRHAASSERRWTVAHLDGGEWRSLDRRLTLPGDAWVELFATDDGDLWAWTFPTLNRWHDGEWTEVYAWHEESAEPGMPMAVGSDGTIWHGEGWGDYALWAFDGSGRRAWSKDEPGTTSIRWGMHVAPDGSLWQTDDPDSDWGTVACPSVVRFDGQRLDRFLEDACTDSIDVGPDGSVWALARIAPDDDPRWDLYVITPEAVAAAESAVPERPSPELSSLPLAGGHVTGTVVAREWAGDGPWPAPTAMAGASYFMGMPTEQQVEWSDPRLPSTMLTVTNLGEHPDPSDVAIVQTWTTTHRLEGPGGAWTGTGRGINNLTGVTDGTLSFIVLTGDGAYEGLSAVLVGTMRDGGDWEPEAYEGYIIVGDPPETPDIIEPFTE